LESLLIRVETEEPTIPSAASIVCLKDVIIPGVSGSAFTWSMPLFPEYAWLQLSTTLQMLDDAGIKVFIDIYLDFGGIRGTTIQTLRKWESKVDKLGWNPDPNGYVSSEEEGSGGEETDTTSNEQGENMESGGPEDVNEETSGDGH
jgi:hypothetical protein